MNIPEEVGKVANTVVDSLRGEPISLALIVMNIIFVGAAGYWAHEVNGRTNQQFAIKDALIEKLINQCHLGKATSFEIEQGGEQ